ncbi:MAG: outer membrane protein assembly factor BamD [Bacteroidales bacterium]|nr:outer membrane protein assembly factor BamD [Bacteroidales bacterium]
MSRIRMIIALAVAILSTAACKSAYELVLEGNDIDLKYATAFDNFENGKYSKAARMFESLSPLVRGSEREDTVQYYWGLSNYKFKDYYTAETNFASFITTFPLSPFAESATYYRIDCMFRTTLRYELDQTPTRKTVAAISEYLTDFPDTPYRDECTRMLENLGDRLDKKAFENARLYYKMEDYKAANVALKNVLKDNSDNRYREDILYTLALASFKYAELSYPEKQKERFLLFVDDYLNFVGEYPESDYRRELDSHYRRAQRFLGRNTNVIADLDETEAEE